LKHPIDQNFVNSNVIVFNIDKNRLLITERYDISPLLPSASDQLDTGWQGIHLLTMAQMFWLVTTII